MSLPSEISSKMTPSPKSINSKNKPITEHTCTSSSNSWKISSPTKISSTAKPKTWPKRCYHRHQIPRICRLRWARAETTWASWWENTKCSGRRIRNWGRGCGRRRGQGSDCLWIEYRWYWYSQFDDNVLAWIINYRSQKVTTTAPPHSPNHKKYPPAQPTCTSAPKPTPRIRTPAHLRRDLPNWEKPSESLACPTTNYPMPSTSKTKSTLTPIQEKDQQRCPWQSGPHR